MQVIVFSAGLKSESHISISEMNPLFSSDISASVAGKINVEVPARHSVSVVTAHSAGNHRKPGTEHAWWHIEIG